MLTLFKKVWVVYKPLHKAIIAIFFVLAITIGLDFVWPYIYGKTLDAVTRGANLHQVLTLLGFAFGVMLVQNLVSWLGGLLELAYFDYESPTLTSNLSLAHLLSLSIGQHRSEHSALTQSVISDGQNGMQNILNQVVYQLAPYTFRIIIGLVILFVFSWPLGLVVFSGVAITFIVTALTNRHFMPLIREERDRDQQVDKKRMEILRNAPVVISNASEEQVMDSSTKELLAVNEFGKGNWKRYFRISYVLRPTIQDLTLVASIAMAAWLAAHGQLSAGLILTVILWTNTTLTNLGSFGGLQRQMLFSGERARKYLGLLDVVSDVKEPASPIRPQAVKGEIRFEDVSFAYPKSRIVGDDDQKKKAHAKPEPDESPREALEQVTFDIKASEHVAFVGASGAGKSTTVLLLLRGSDPQSGRITVDGIDLREIDLGFYRRHVGVVEQHIVLFDDTIRRNISFGLSDGRELTDAELDRLAEISRVSEFKDKLVDGWDTVIGENGIKLSGGQRQRVGIARALAKDPSILILDEATSSLDAKNEALIKDALKDASKGRTTIMVAHRLSTIRDADRIFVFDKGRIADIGTHEELLKTSKIYADLVSHQTVLL